ncbi:polymer-forming cytoskeletal protein [Paenibacillus sp. GCM10023252]|uniref:bactofilin family protein n=1 Tax=Paenibacillus sp. GCM10023252 TaxID=3252649 RepID=UPI00360B2465
MFKRKSNRINATLTDTLIGEGTVFEGKLSSEGSIRIEGHIVGDVYSAGDVTIGENGTAISNITAQNVRLAGYVKGDVQVRGKLYVYASGSLIGNLSAEDLHIESGGVFQGSSRMATKELSLPPETEAIDNLVERTAIKPSLADYSDEPYISTSTSFFAPQQADAEALHDEEAERSSDEAAAAAVQTAQQQSAAASTNDDEPAAIPQPQQPSDDSLPLHEEAIAHEEASAGPNDEEADLTLRLPEHPEFETADELADEQNELNLLSNPPIDAELSYPLLDSTTTTSADISAIERPMNEAAVQAEGLHAEEPFLAKPDNLDNTVLPTKEEVHILKGW